MVFVVIIFLSVFNIVMLELLVFKFFCFLIEVLDKIFLIEVIDFGRILELFRLIRFKIECLLKLFLLFLFKNVISCLEIE